MSHCLQTEGQTILQHGHAVHIAWLKLLAEKPDCLNPYWDCLLADIAKWDPRDIRAYHIFHDCGKPRCLNLDTEGKRHFPNHAQISFETWKEFGGSDLIGQWILHDMDIHTMLASDMDAFLQNEGSEILLLTGLAELQANAKMFGGLDSTSYKIKFKRWHQRAKAYLRRRYPHGG